ncbi:DUF397 domain-containing protein [Streptomyces sp. NBC_01142]|uniref:DUF397 domain-containing protein n=1 Tax=Streptomyces sp. NBC_01142 TaxID=2975865 RepID=UPI00225A53CA|nr:DUF397 domain-containing protein [Streptomyces sp. NBC_01142]MCX4823778.1 DUF397 domain-containing protein [Streptomyces sp. NBC_01142]
MLIRHDALTEWTKSSYSAVNGDCVEVRAEDRRTVAIRDSKNPRSGTLGLSAEAWSTFILDVGRTTPPGA